MSANATAVQKCQKLTMGRGGMRKRGKIIDVLVSFNAESFQNRSVNTARVLLNHVRHPEDFKDSTI